MENAKDTTPVDLKTLADVKRALAAPGCVVTVVRNDYRAKRGPLPPDYFQPRTVRKLQTNAVCFNTADKAGSWFYFPKAKCVRCEGNTVAFCMTGDGGFSEVLVYHLAFPAIAKAEGRP